MKAYMSQIAESQSHCALIIWLLKGGHRILNLWHIKSHWMSTVVLDPPVGGSATTLIGIDS
jgi:hypothetical protein